MFAVTERKLRLSELFKRKQSIEKAVFKSDDPVQALQSDFYCTRNT
jgi:hypothetical protein